MTDTVVVGLIAASAAILTGLITGLFTYKASARTRDVERYKGRLKRALMDVAAFYELERLYCEHLASSGDKSPEAVKREFRSQLREAGLRSPSEESAPARLEAELESLA